MLIPMVTEPLLGLPTAAVPKLPILDFPPSTFAKGGRALCYLLLDLQATAE